MDYQALYDAIARRNQREDEIDNELIAAGKHLRTPSDEELQEEREKQYHQYLSRFTETQQTPTERSYEATKLVIVAAEISPDYLEQALDHIEQESEIQRANIVQAAIALLGYETKFPTSIDFQAEREIVQRALIS
jgi:hypothetical protein